MQNSSKVLKHMVSAEGISVYDYSFKKELLLVFLRHFGCTFCREALEELSQLKEELHGKDKNLVLVHMSTEDRAIKYFQRYNLTNVISISDPECQYYRDFGLMKGTFNQLFGFRSWFRGIEAGLIKGYGFGKQLGDGFQMPGVFVVKEGKIISEFRHKFASDKPNYKEMVDCYSTQ